MPQAPYSRPASSDRATPAQLGAELREALPSLRLHAVSVHDAEGEALWLSEGFLGPDEHGATLEAMGEFALENASTVTSRSLGDGRSAALFAVRTGTKDLVGLAMVIADSKLVDGGAAQRMLTPPVATILQRLALVLKPPAAAQPIERLAVPEPATAAATSEGAVRVARVTAGPPRAAPAGAGPKPPAHVAPTPTTPRAAANPARREAPPAASARVVPSKEPPQRAPATPIAADASPPGGPIAPESLFETLIFAAATPPTDMAVVDFPSAAPAPAVAAPAASASRAPAPAVRPAPPAPKAARVEARAPIATTAARPAPARAAPMEPRAPAAPRPHAGTGADATLYVPQKAVREVTLHVQQLLKLRSGGRTRRYEVLLRSRSRPEADSMSDTMAEILASQGETSTIDRYIAGELIVWLGAHRDVWDTDPSSFSVNLAPSTMFDAEFLLWIAQRLAEFEVGPGVIGFELPERAFVENRAAAERFVAQCEKLGCFLVLDDFTLHSEALPSLASSAVRLVKVDAALTTRALREKLAQAMVIGIAQCAKVLGVHCVAKRVDTAMARQWLSAVGIDFAQGFLLEKPRPLEELATTGAAAKA